MKEGFVVPEPLLERVKGKTLFYPCSGADFDIPIRLFCKYIDDFWFVDTGYFCNYSQGDVRGSEGPANERPPLLQDEKDFRFERKTIRGPFTWDYSDRDIEPCLVTEEYLHIPTQRHITVRRRRGYGYSAFRTEPDIAPLGVFFYRGDSFEGGSGNWWFTEEHLGEICDRLIDGGLIVTDSSGANPWCTRNNWSFFGLPENMSEEEIMEVAQKRSFSEAGCRFNCRGIADIRGANPTMIWEVVREPGFERKEWRPHPSPPSKYQKYNSRYPFYYSQYMDARRKELYLHD